MKRKQLTINLGPQHEAWLELAKRESKRPATLAREVLLFALEHNGTMAKEPLGNADGKKGLYVRLNPEELAALDVVAKAMKRRRTKTVIAILRDAIFKEVQFSLDEQKELIKSNRELGRIGVNINQIAKGINSLKLEGRPQDALKVVQLAKKLTERTHYLEEGINSHIKTIWRLINSGRYRWSQKPPGGPALRERRR